MQHDDLHYHVTFADRLPRIREEGLRPSAEWACFGPDADPEDTEGLLRVFLCDRPAGAERYRKEMGKHGPVVLLAVPGHALTDVEEDEAMKGDCYVDHAIPPEAIEVVHPDGSREPLLAAAPAP